MANPFEQNKAILAEHIREYFKNKRKGDTFEMDTLGHDVIRFRANVFQVAKLEGFKIRTRSNDTGFYIYILESPNAV